VTKPAPGFQVRFLQNLQRLLSEGMFVATYKYALLLALADISVEKGDDSGAQLEIPTRLIAEKFIAYYWRHSIPYIQGGSGKLLRQNTGKPAAILCRVQEVRRESGDSLATVARDESTWRGLVSVVDAVVRDMPLWKLQTVGTGQMEFLYENLGRGRTITLKPGVAYCHRQFYGLIGDLVRGAWVRYIRHYNKEALGTTADLSEFLFGSERSSLATVQPILQDLQHGQCFYCHRSIRRDAAHVDHFIPWSRYPIDLGHNFVLSHGSCNSSKSDHLAAVDHLAAWAERNSQHGEELVRELNSREVVHDLEASKQIAHWAYTQVETSGGLTWIRGKELVPLRPTWATVLRGRGHPLV